MPRRYQASILSGSYRPFLTPNAPTSVSASAGNAQATISFTAPSNTGGAAITSYTVISSGGHIATGSSSPITVTGLTNDVSYTFTVYASNTYGPGARSLPSAAVTPTLPLVGQQAYTTAGTYSWTAPAGVTSVCVVCVGGGSSGAFGNGGGGGALAYGNNISVTPGQSYTVVAGAGNVNPGGQSYFGSAALLYANGGNGNSGGAGGGTARNGGGNGGNSGGQSCGPGGGGGGGGYAGNGGNGGDGTCPPGTVGDWNWGGPSSGGSGGAGGGGAGSSSVNSVSGEASYSGGYGGGVGILGQGTSGAGIPDAFYQANGNPGSGGSGASYGGGSGGTGDNGYNPGGGGAVRIIWGPGRAFPSTNTGNM